MRRAHLTASTVFACLCLVACAADLSSAQPGEEDGGASAGDGSASGGGRDGGAPDGGGGDMALPPVDPSKPNCKYQAHKTGLSAFQQAGGLAFHVYAPPGYDPKVAHTEVIIMHSQDSDGTPELTSLWQALADREQLVLLAPKGSRPSTNPSAFPSGANWSVNDLNAVQDLITEVDDCYSVAPKKHILWGFSEGGFYGYLLGIGASAQFSGLAMGGANAGFARSNGYPPSAIAWPIPVSHVQGTTDPNGTAPTLQDQKDFQAAGSTFKLYQPAQGHTITPAQVQQQYDDLKGSSSP